MDSQSYLPVPPGVGMEENFLSLDDILLSHERLPSRTECLFPRLGFLEKSTDSQDIQEVCISIVTCYWSGWPPKRGLGGLNKYVFHHPSPRARRWSSHCGWQRACMRGRGEWSPSSYLKCTGKAGGRCLTLTPRWWTFTRWALTTMAWGPRCCTLIVQRTQKLHRLCCR